MKKENQPELNSVKGMRDFTDGEYYAYQGFYEKAAEIAHYYGFAPLETPILEKEELFARGSGQDTDVVQKEMYTLRTKGGDHLTLRPEFTPAVMRAYIQNGFQSQPQPVMLYSYGPAFRHDKPQRGRYRQFYQFNLDVIGTGKSIVDAMVIKLILLSLEEAGLKNLRVEINSIGDKECRGNYRRELSNYYKKNVRSICADCRERLKTNPLRLLDCKNPECQEIKAGAPSSLNFLCTACKAHFKEVVEYLDQMDINYEINTNLVRGLDYYSRTVFEIFDPEVTSESGSPLTIAGGGRYDYLARSLGNKKDISAVGGAIGVDRVMLSPNYQKQNPKLIKKPKLFFIQLSFDAKLKSMEIIEVLRHAKIPLAQSLSKDSLGTQLAIAEKLGVPYTLILGQKEALDNTVIVRDMNNRSQEIISIPKLAEYLKGLK